MPTAGTTGGSSDKARTRRRSHPRGFVQAKITAR